MKDNFLKMLWEAVYEKKALEPVVLDLKGVSGVTDYFLICSGNSQVQVRAIADNISDKLNEQGLPITNKEGYADGRWVLMDFGDIVVHVMTQTEREFYALEKLWRDAKIITDLA